MLREDPPDPQHRLALHHEFELASKLDLPSVVKAYAITHPSALILEDFGGKSLKSFVSHNLSLASLLSVGVRVVRALEQLHAARVVHKDIKPSNIIVSDDLSVVKLSDLGVASQLSRETAMVLSPHLLEGTLAYMSPEQTGRMNRGVDQRSDLYSLGVTLYELATGELPFQNNDANDLLYAHVARRPVPPNQRRPELPQVISDIILRLLQKAPEARYQSAAGVRADLERCLRDLDQGAVHEFVLGQSDHAPNLRFPERLFGREAQIQALEAAYDRVCEGARAFAVVGGAPGIGKTALVHELYKKLPERRAVLISGKHDQLQRDAPFRALLGALQQLLRWLLTEPDAVVQRWRQDLLQALGANGRIISAVLPELRLLIGDQPAVPELPSTEAERRFQIALRDFLRVFTTREQPLVVFLDDLQWADAATLRFLEFLLSDGEQRHLMVIGAYRSNELPSDHPLLAMVDAVAANGAIVDRVELAPLSAADVVALVAETLRCSTEKAQALGQSIARKTDGTPLFVLEALNALFERGLLHYDDHRWHWNLDAVNAASLTPSIVELLTEVIAHLSAQEREAIQLAACIGHQFTLGDLADLLAASVQQTVDRLWSALDRGLLLPGDGKYKYARLGGAEAQLAQSAEIRFAHDRIRRAAYDMLDDGSRRSAHLRIGRVLLKKAGDDPDHNVFAIADHFNQCHDLITASSERLQLAQLDLLAGQRARQSTAYEQAHHYLASSRELLPEDAWQTHYALTLKLSVEWMEAAYLAGDFQKATDLFSEISSRAQSALERARAASTWMAVNLHFNRPEEAIRVGREALDLLDYRLPKSVAMRHVVSAALHTAWRLRKHNAASLQVLPRAMDPAHEEISRIMMSLVVPAYLAEPMLLRLLPARMVQYCLDHGSTAHTAYGFAVFAVLSTWVLGNQQRGNEPAEASLRIDEQCGTGQHVAKILLVHGTRLSHARHHWPVGVDILRRAIRAGLETGDLINAGYAADGEALFCFVGGRNLSEVAERVSYALGFARTHKNQWSIAYDHLLFQATEALRGNTCRPDSLDAESFREADFVAEHRGDRLLLHTHALVKTQLLLLAGSPDQAFEVSSSGQQYLDDAVGLISVPEFLFWQGMAAAACSRFGRDQKKALRAAHRKLARWAGWCPENYAARALLLEAEIARRQSKWLKAVALYDRAVERAEADGFVQCVAMALERSADMHRQLGANGVAGYFRDQALGAYKRWGAEAKARELGRGLLVASTAREQPRDFTIGTDSRNHSEALDFAAVMQASQMLSGETVLANVLISTMQLLLRASGAERAVLLLCRGGKLVAEAEAEGPNDVRVLQSIELEKAVNIPHAVIRYAARTRERLLVHDSAKEPAYRGDPYLASSPPLSLFCVPIIHQGALLGLIYCENKLATGSFAEGRLQVVTILAQQVALAVQQADSVIDSLTRIWTRGYWQERVTAEVSAAVQHNHPGAMLLIDLDHFKHKNDTYGHPAGDAILRETARRISKVLRPSDLVGRYGGEEIAVFLPNTDREGLLIVAERLRRSVIPPVAIGDGHEVRQTVSIGGALLPDHGTAVESLVAAADRALYRSKSQGRDRVTLADSGSNPDGQFS